MRSSVILVVMIVLQGLSSGANIVQDPSFENVGLAPWISSGHPWGVDTASSHTGLQSAGTGCAGTGCIAADPDPLGAWLYQDLATTAGTSYNLSFWIGLRGTKGGTVPNEMKVLWNGVEVFDIQNLTNTMFQQYSVGVVAQGSTTRLEFLGRNDPNVIDLDDVSVDAGAGIIHQPPSTPDAAVPEPSTAVPLAIGIGLAVLSRLGDRRPL